MARLLCYVLLFVVGGCSHKPVAQLVEEGEEATGKEAIRLYTQAIDNEPTNVRALWRRGDEYAKADQPEKALADFTHAIALEPTYNAGYLFGDRGEVFEAKNNLPEAIRDYTSALAIRRKTLSPSLPSTPMENFYFYRGRARLKAGDTTAALVDTDSAIFYYDKFPRAHYQRARLAVIRGDYERALVDYQVGSLVPEDAADEEFIDDVFYLGLLKFKRQDATYCAYWAAAAQHHQKKAKAYLTKYCQSGGKKH
jgi:tetratricopeptide (TPR) repeat protein